MHLLGRCSNTSRVSVGAECDQERVQLLLSQVAGKDITELIAAGREKLANVPSGGGAVAVAAPAGGGGGAPAAAAEAKKEEKVEEKEESDGEVSCRTWILCPSVLMHMVYPTCLNWRT